LTLAATLELWGIPVNFRLIFFFVYGTFLPIMTGVKVVYLIQNRKIDEEFQRIFQPTETQ